MSMTNYFPLGVATGAAFCNRAAERLQLKKNIANNQHTIFISPRRYGKTSLAHQAIKENQVVWGEADFLTVADDEMVKLRILAAVEQALTQLFPPHQRILKKIVSYFKSLRPSLVIQADGAKIVLESSGQALESIQDALQALDLAASNAKQRVVLLFDEFQQMGTLKHAAPLEGTIRHCAQFAKYVTYFFSGSNRHLLSIMFDDSTRPLYHLCDRIFLTRIDEKEYRPFIQHAAKMMWHTALSESILDQIFALTAYHPYYINALCTRLWRQTDIPSLEEVNTTWQTYVMEEHYRLAAELAPLSPNQRAILTALAKDPIAEPTSRQFLMRVRLPAASSTQAVNVLLEKDLLHRVDNILRILDPVMEFYLKNH